MFACYSIDAMKIYLGADHRGFNLKEFLKKKLEQEKIDFEDLGDDKLNPDDDYVDFAHHVAERVVSDPGSMGILICGSGAGVDMVANKIDGIRSALVFDIARAIQAREDEDANVLSLPADVLSDDLAWEIVQTFILTPFSMEDRHIRRLEKLKKVEDTHE